MPTRPPKYAGKGPPETHYEQGRGKMRRREDYMAEVFGRRSKRKRRKRSRRM